ncbi:hypothetical protein BDZ97DRAFT_2055315 [Flammula alnicola]|nr:hypothetical protein BDZ97DRAFT_2055315 [Flammula alnicola]
MLPFSSFRRIALLNGIFLGTTKKRATKREVKDAFEALSDSEKQKWPALCKEKLHKRRKYEMLWPWGSEWAKWLEGGMARVNMAHYILVLFGSLRYTVSHSTCSGIVRN